MGSGFTGFGGFGGLLGLRVLRGLRGLGVSALRGARAWARTGIGHGIDFTIPRS